MSSADRPRPPVRVRTARVDPAGATAALLPAESERVERAALADRPAVALSLLLARALAAEVCGVPADAIRVDRRCPRCGSTSHGAPRVRRADQGPVPHLSLSRTVDRVVVAVSTVGPVGVDVERADAEPAARAALGADVGASSGAPAGTRRSGDLHATARGEAEAGAAVRAWTRAEALLKAAGTGLTLDPRDVRVSDAAGRPVVVGDHPAPPPGTRWWLDDLHLGASHVGALALAVPALP